MTEADTVPREERSDAGGDDGASRAMDLADELAALSSDEPDEAEADVPEEVASRDAEADAGDESEGGAEGSDADTGATDRGGADDEGGEAERGADESMDLGTIVRHLQEDAPGLIGRSFDGVAGVRPDDDGWVAIAEFLERSAVPDTEDILGLYRIELGDDGEVRGYERLDRYRRGDTRPAERGAASAFE